MGKVRSLYRLSVVSRHTGVSLAELMAVLAIVCIAAAIALPSMEVFASRRAITQQADEIGAFLNRIREKAVRDGIYWRIELISDSAQWYAYGDSNGNSRYDPGDRYGGKYRLAREIIFGSHASAGPNSTSIPQDGISFTENRICFSPSGSCNSGTIYIKSKERSVAMRLLPASGTVVLYEYDTAWRLLR